MKIFKSSAVFLLIVSLVIGMLGCSNPKESVTLNVSAAGSLTDAVAEINSLFMQNNASIEILANFAASGDLQTQIENGAPADVFISADARQMNVLEEKELILPETRSDLLNNSIVLIVPEGSTLEIAGFEDLANDEITQIAIGDPEFVPAGSYGRQAFELLGISYEGLLPKLILANNVRQVLSYVESGNVDAGIVVASDAVSSSAVKVVATAPDEINGRIAYPVAVIASSGNIE
ncbi:MAG: molybdate ABC transporter substrate-binding protein, partial [Clostridia bacterium]|nr:molybdate ABC transporter substrate-binding protein [Clostridia bacterium]